MDDRACRITYDLRRLYSLLYNGNVPLSPGTYKMIEERKAVTSAVHLPDFQLRIEYMLILVYVVAIVLEK